MQTHVPRATARRDLVPLAVGFLRCALAAVLLACVRVGRRLARAGGVALLLRISAASLAVGAGLALYQSCYFAAVARAG